MPKRLAPPSPRNAYLTPRSNNQENINTNTIPQPKQKENQNEIKAIEKQKDDDLLKESLEIIQLFKEKWEEYNMESCCTSYIVFQTIGFKHFKCFSKFSTLFQCLFNFSNFSKQLIDSKYSHKQTNKQKTMSKKKLPHAPKRFSGGEHWRSQFEIG